MSFLNSTYLFCRKHLIAFPARLGGMGIEDPTQVALSQNQASAAIMLLPVSIIMHNICFEAKQDIIFAKKRCEK